MLGNNTKYIYMYHHLNRNQTRKRRGGGSSAAGSPSSSNVDTKRIAELFGVYADEERSTIIDMEGISRLGEVKKLIVDGRGECV